MCVCVCVCMCLCVCVCVCVCVKERCAFDVGDAATIIIFQSVNKLFVARALCVCD